MNLNDFEIVKMEPPHDDLIWVKVIIKIRHNKTDKIREIIDTAIWDTDKNNISLYIWEKGNYSCDCNREIFFNQVLDKKNDNIECGRGKYSVNIHNYKNGDILYKEFN